MSLVRVVEYALPQIGVFDAKNKTTQDLSREIRSSVETKGEKLGDFSIDIERYRPFYVAGLVEHPGSYEFLPGLTVLQAVALAGGLRRSPLYSPADLWSEKRTLTETMSRIGELAARRARLEAERVGTPTVTASQELLQIDPSQAKNLIADERAVMDRSHQVLNGDKAELESLLVLKDSEAKGYEREIARLEQRIEEQTKIFSDLQKLHEDRIINQQRFFEAVIALDSLRRDKQSTVSALSQVRAALEVARSQLARLTLSDNARIAKEIAETEAELTRLRRIAVQAREAIANLEPLESQSITGLVPEYKIMRRNANGQLDFMKAEETTAILPGDVVQVEDPRDGTALRKLRPVHWKALEADAKPLSICLNRLGLAPGPRRLRRPASLPPQRLGHCSIVRSRRLKPA